MQLAVISPSFLPWHPLRRHPWLAAAQLCQRGRLPFPCSPASAVGLFLSSDVPRAGRTSRNYHGAVQDQKPVWARWGLGTKPIPPILLLSWSQDGLWLFLSHFSNLARGQERIQHQFPAQWFQALRSPRPQTHALLWGPGPPGFSSLAPVQPYRSATGYISIYLLF